MQGFGGVKKSSSILSQISFNSSPIPLSYSNYLLDEPEGLETIYRAMIGNREREMKLRALCDAQLSAKSVSSSLLCSAKSQNHSKGPGDGSVTGARSTEGSKLQAPVLLKYTDTAKGTGSQGMAEETKGVKEFTENNTFSSAKSSTAASSAAAESQAAGQKQQLPPFMKICSKPDPETVTKALQNPGMDLGMVLEHQLGVTGELRHKAATVEKQIAGAGQVSLQCLLYGDVLSRPCVRDQKLLKLSFPFNNPHFIPGCWHLCPLTCTYPVGPSHMLK